MNLSFLILNYTSAIGISAYLETHKAQLKSTMASDVAQKEDRSFLTRSHGAMKKLNALHRRTGAKCAVFIERNGKWLTYRSDKKFSEWVSVNFDHSILPCKEFTPDNFDTVADRVNVDTTSCTPTSPLWRPSSPASVDPALPSTPPAQSLFNLPAEPNMLSPDNYQAQAPETTAPPSHMTPVPHHDNVRPHVMSTRASPVAISSRSSPGQSKVKKTRSRKSYFRS